MGNGYTPLARHGNADGHETVRDVCRCGSRAALGATGGADWRRTEQDGGPAPDGGSHDDAASGDGAARRGDGRRGRARDAVRADARRGYRELERVRGAQSDRRLVSGVAMRTNRATALLALA